ncbi:MAG: hypothetical protein PHO03_04990 [Candidatus Omnitrophica bacterium]|nr:hypothetical protein [Candidatus Omnitrophota bacterium]
MKKRLLLLGPAVFLLAGILGCASLSDKKQGSTAQSLQAQSILKFGDLPVPAGFKIQAKDSYSFESSGIRVGLLRYQGKASLDQVVNFYKEQMPMYSWTLLNLTEYGDCIMNFEREAESCIVYIAPKGGQATISISLGPKAPVLTKKARPAVK